MLQIQENTKLAFLNDSTHKELEVEFENVTEENINYFYGIPYTNKKTVDATAGSMSTTTSALFNHPKGTASGGLVPMFCDMRLFTKYAYCYIYLKPQLYFEVLNGTCDIDISRVEIRVKYNNTRYSYRRFEGAVIESALSGHKRTSFYLTLANLDYSLQYPISYIDFVINYTVSNIQKSGSENVKVQWNVKAIETMFVLSNLDWDYHETPPYKPCPQEIIDGGMPELFNIPVIKNENVVSESLSLTESICSQENLKFGLCEASYISFDVANRLDNFKGKYFKAYIKNTGGSERIPLGRFKVSEVKKKSQGELITKKITGFDEMTMFNQDASDWYAQYMYALSSKEYPKGYEYTRQMFSTMYNFMKTFNFNMDDFDDTDLRLVYQAGEIASHATSNTYVYNEFTYTPISPNPQPITAKSTAKMYKFEINDVNPNNMYYFDKVNDPSNATDIWIINRLIVKQNYTRGILTNGSVMIEEFLSDGSTNKFLVDAKDYFMVSPTCTRFNIYYGCFVDNVTSDGAAQSFAIISDVMLYSRPAPQWCIDLINRSTRLVYYNWKTKEIPKYRCTMRDVLRSLFEINGAFCRINRYGKFEILYAEKQALYPSNDLYPRDDLYPQKGPNLLPRAYYIDSQQEDYLAQDFGKIQILSNNASEGAITSKVFQGNENLDSTYIINDNVFLSNGGVIFDEDLKNGSSSEPVNMLPELDVMLANMWFKISNTSYTPNTTKAIGMPWVEVGDRITLLTNNSGFESFIFTRTLNGVQMLTDTYESKGDDIIPEAN